jgi:hypothetical protein
MDKAFLLGLGTNIIDASQDEAVDHTNFQQQQQHNAKW